MAKAITVRNAERKAGGLPDLVQPEETERVGRHYRISRENDYRLKQLQFKHYTDTRNPIALDALVNKAIELLWEKEGKA